MNKKYLIAIDMGGRTAKCGIFDIQTQKTIKKFIIKTKTKDEVLPYYYQEILKVIKELNIDWDKEIKIIGFGCVGPLDPIKGISINAGKIGWFNYPIKEKSAKLFKKPICLINDARSIAYGEWKKGAGRNYHTFIIYSIGTGIGGGIILNNSLYLGAHNLANEFGHGGWTQNEFQCNCGLPGCIEGLSSSTGIEKYFQKYILNNPQSLLAKRSKQLNKNLEIKDIADLVKDNNKEIIDVLTYCLKPLAHSISMMIYAFDPQAVLIGGGPSALGKPLIDILNKLLKQIVWKDLYDKVDIKLCELQNEAGLIGVIEYTLDQLRMQKIHYD